MFCAIAEPPYQIENTGVFSISTQNFALLRKGVSLLTGHLAGEKGPGWERVKG
jgi:hypothetical protein